MDCSLPGSSVHGLFQARILEWVVFIYIYIYMHVCIYITSVSLLRLSAFSAFSFVSREFAIDCGSIFQDSCFYILNDLGEMRASDI